MDVFNLDSDVMHSRAAPGEKFSHGCFLAERLEQLNVSVADRQHAYLNTLLCNLFGGIHCEAEGVSPNCQTLFDASSGDSDVINLQQLELSPPPQNKGLVAGLQLHPRAG